MEITQITDQDERRWRAGVKLGQVAVQVDPPPDIPNPTGRPQLTTTLTTDQARAVAEELIKAADEAEGQADTP